MTIFNKFPDPFDPLRYDLNDVAAYDPKKTSKAKRAMLSVALVFDPALDATSRQLIAYVLAHANNKDGGAFPFEERAIMAKALDVTENRVRFLFRSPAVERWMIRSGHKFFFRWDRAVDFDKWFKEQRKQIKAETEAKVRNIKVGRKRKKAPEVTIPPPPLPKTIADMQAEEHVTKLILREVEMFIKERDSFDLTYDPLLDDTEERAIAWAAECAMMERERLPLLRPLGMLLSLLPPARTTSIPVMSSDWILWINPTFANRLYSYPRCLSRSRSARGK